jgi:hypothetical protein
MQSLTFPIEITLLVIGIDQWGVWTLWGVLRGVPPEGGPDRTSRSGDMTFFVKKHF